MAKKNQTRVPSETECSSEGRGSGPSESPPEQMTTTRLTTSGSSANRPLKTFRLKGVKASVFENRTEQGAFYKTSLQKVYRDGEEWKTTTSLGRDDLPVAQLLLGRAWEFILETEAAARNGDQGE